LLLLTLDGIPSQILFAGTDGANCEEVIATVEVLPEAWNAAGDSGSRTLGISGQGIDPDFCEDPRITVEVRYQRVPEDCDQDGTWDRCQPDTDGDGAIDACETCDEDPFKTEPGDCDCGVPDVDTDGDGLLDCVDDCPSWPGACSADGQVLLLAPGDSIALAMQAVPDGGVIELQAGIHAPETTLDPGGRSFTLRGVVDGSGELTSILDGGDSIRLIQCISGEDETTVFENLVFRNGNGGDDDGGGLYNEASSPTLTNCRFESNSALNGGGMSNRSGSAPRIVDCHFNGNTASGSGGGIDNRLGSTPELSGCTFTGNDANYGGGLHSLADCDPILVACSFSGNTAVLFGGGLRSDSGTPVLTDCEFTENQAGSGGGGIASTNSIPELSGSTVCLNTPDQISGTYANLDANCVSTECDRDEDGTFDCADGCPDDPGKIEPGTCGCGVPETDTDADGTPDCTDDCPDWPYACSEDGLTYTVAPGESIQLALDTLPPGGTIELAPGTFPIDGFDGLVPPAGAFTLRGARDKAGELLSILDAGGFGRHLTIQTGVGRESLIEDLVLSGGRVNTNGGSILITNGSSPTIRGCQFLGNTTTQGDGGAIHHVGGDPLVEQCTFVGNSAQEGGAIYSLDAQPVITGCTFESNLAQGGGALVLENSDGTVESSSFRFNSADRGGAIYVGSAAPVIIGCRIEENIASIVGGGLYGYLSAIDLTGSILCGNVLNQYAGNVLDPGANCILDECGTDLDGNGLPDGCDPDCDADGEPDAYELTSGQATDCTGDGVPDACLLADGTAEDCNTNGIPDQCDLAEGADDDNTNGELDVCEIARGDLDLDGCIGGADLAILLAFYGTNAPIGDLNGDGTIGGADLATLLARWDPCG
jgi:predicted outer membrane repeat protein